jgi:NAD(P)-dependent dehydrogenase (short-subunit alcohol dehydrogenase family)
MPTPPLSGQVAVVAGATRGAGRGIARALGEAGAFVYCTGRSVRGAPSPYNRSETLDDTADMITAAGGKAQAVKVDHADEAQVEALFARVQSEHGRLDLLVDTVAGEDPRYGGWGSFWSTDLAQGADVLRNSLLSHLITAKHAAPLMIKRKRGLIVEVVEGDTIYGASSNPLNNVVKAALKSFACSMAEELRKHRVAAVAITPGFLRSETMLENFGVTEANWQDAGKKDPAFLHSESPLFVGRAVAALAADPTILDRSGNILSSWELAREYGFTDVDGHRPDWGEHFGPLVKAFGMLDMFKRHAAFLDRMHARMQRYLDRAEAAPATAPSRKGARSKRAEPEGTSTSRASV